jgi:hypothetical protein
MAEQQASEAGERAESVLSEWLQQRQRVRDHARQLREAQERVMTLEQNHSWLGQVKGMLRKKDGNIFNIPKGSKIATVAPEGETQPAPPQASQKTPSQPKEEIGKKRKTAPLPMENPKREAESACSPAGASTSTPRNRIRLRDLTELFALLPTEAHQARKVVGRKDYLDSSAISEGEDESRAE